MKELNTKRICDYINKVCAEAAASEGRPNDVKWQFCMVHNHMIFAMKTGYIRVWRRVMYRLQRNVEKNFGVQFKPISTNVRDSLSWDDKFHGYDFFPMSDGVDPNYSFTSWELFGEKGTLRAFRDELLLNPQFNMEGSKCASKHYQDLCELHGVEQIKYSSWEDYCEDYKKLYGYEPYKIKETFHN